MSQSVVYRPGDPEGMARELCAAGMDFVDVTTPATPGELFMIRHGLGRVPHGAWIVKGSAFDFAVTDCTAMYVSATATDINVALTVAVA